MNEKWTDRKLLANRFILLLIIGMGFIICFTTFCATPTSTTPRRGCLAECVDYYSKVPYADNKELWRAIVDNNETTLNFEEWKKEVHTKRDHYIKYSFCPKACNDLDIYRPTG